MKWYKGKKIGRKLLLIIGLILTITAIARAKANNRAIAYQKYYVHSGDTLWTIAAERKGENIDIRKYVYDLRQLNNLKSANIYPGQELLLPKEK